MGTRKNHDAAENIGFLLPRMLGVEQNIYSAPLPIHRFRGRFLQLHPHRISTPPHSLACTAEIYPFYQENHDLDVGSRQSMHVVTGSFKVTKPSGVEDQRFRSFSISPQTCTTSTSVVSSVCYQTESRRHGRARTPNSDISMVQVSSTRSTTVMRATARTGRPRGNK